MIFADRREAGRKLAERLVRFREGRPVVLALPRGGVPVGFEIARALAAPLDLVLVRKLGAPGQPELAIGALALGDEVEFVTDPELLAALGVLPASLEAIKAREAREIERRRKLYLGENKPVAIAGCTAILVDDGIATGATMRAALRASRKRKPARLVLAVPVAPPDTIARLGPEADEIVCLAEPRSFLAVGQFYRSFPQLEDREVLELLEEARRFAPGEDEG
ncbi:MAG TPA: phosphoribosyltransferase family protein [Acetobacteraceae bacterium]|jgi:putative phosphoribosyl transferase|nr:phosphoribosyltransferase family protein [Acetobacteraceae bacterium]